MLLREPIEESQPQAVRSPRTAMFRLSFMRDRMNTGHATLTSGRFQDAPGVTPIVPQVG